MIVSVKKVESSTMCVRGELSGAVVEPVNGIEKLIDRLMLILRGPATCFSM